MQKALRGIINIVTKQTNVSGFSGSFSGGVGTRQNNGNLNLNYNKNRFSLSVNAGGNLTWPQTSITDFNQDFHLPGANHIAQSSDGTSLVKRYGSISSVTASYDFNAYNGITSTFRYNKGAFTTTTATTTSKTNEQFLTNPDSTYQYVANGMNFILQSAGLTGAWIIPTNFPRTANIISFYRRSGAKVT